MGIAISQTSLASCFLVSMFGAENFSLVAAAILDPNLHERTRSFMF